MKKAVVTFGEVMMRLSPPGFRRFAQAGTFEVTYGGGEANVAVSLAAFGLPARFVTRLPQNDLGDACESFLLSNRVDTGSIVRGGDRLGIYFLETGAAQRGSRVIYDRAGSAFADIQPGMVDWDAAFRDASWFHWTGITPAVSRGAAETLLEGLRHADRYGLTISCDLNFRSKLWNWGRTAAEVMPELVNFCDVIIGNEEDAARVFDIHAPGSDITGGSVDGQSYQAVTEQLRRRFPRARAAAVTLRSSHSASSNSWSAVLDYSGVFYQAPLYRIEPIVDRVGGGDAFCGGLIYGMQTGELSTQGGVQEVLDFATAASCLKHSIPGDVNRVSADEVERLMGGDASGRVRR